MLRRSAPQEEEVDPTIVLAGVVGMLKAGLSAQAAWGSVGVTHIADDGTPQLPWRGSGAAVVQAACRLSHQTGAPLAAVLETVGTHVASVVEADARREAAIAGPRLSARVLSLLPVVGLGLGALVDPAVLSVVALTPIGWVLLAAGGTMTWLGRAWMARMTTRAIDQAREP